MTDQTKAALSGKLTIRAGRDAFISRAVEEPDITWRVLTTLNVFRLVVATLLLVLFFAGGDEPAFGSRQAPLYTATASAWLVFAVVFGIALQKRITAYSVLGLTAIIVDTAAVAVLLFTSNGVSSGLGGLLVVFVGAGSLVLPSRMPAVVAALATFAILGQELFAGLRGYEPNYPGAGLLSAIIFAMALAVRPLARRIEESEALARQRGVDLKNLSELNEYIVQHLRESIVVIDGDNLVRLHNSSAAQLLGVPDSMRGRSLERLSPPLAEYIAQWRTDPARSSHPELTLVTGEHSVRLAAHLAPLTKDHERSGATLIFLEDSSLMNARVQQSKLASLGRLSASIAHEIRNPVGAMSHAAQLLAETASDADRRLTEIIRTHSNRVSHIIENVLQLSRRESSSPERFALRPWLEDFAHEFTRTLELQEGELSMDAVPDDLYVRMDPSHLRQVLWNLCDNAIKYASETGGILVELHAGGAPGASRPYLEVRDHGHGVEPAATEKIFEPFYTERAGGTGLGLYISRELCELNRATLIYLDRPGGGAIFRIVFADPHRWESQDPE